MAVEIIPSLAQPRNEWWPGMSRRCAVWQLPADGDYGFLEILAGRALVLNLPADTVLRRLSYDANEDALLILFESESFDETPVGQRFPRLELTCERVP